MKKGLSEIIAVIDRSGSMDHLTTDVIGGFNSFINEQRALPGKAKLTTVLFDNQYEVLHENLDLEEVQPLTTKEYFVRGTTALLDAIGRTITDVGNRLHNTPEEERPETVIFVIMTDGFENCSATFTKRQIREMIDHQKNKYSWKFMFLGANQDSWAVGGAIGINSCFNYTASPGGVADAYRAMNNYSTECRTNVTTTPVILDYNAKFRITNEGEDTND